MFCKWWDAFEKRNEHVILSKKKQNLFKDHGYNIYQPYDFSKIS